LRNLELGEGTLKMSAYQGRTEAIGARSERRE
jgi:hypothetical protein